MKRGVVFAILVILLSLGFFLGRQPDGAQEATVTFDNTPTEKGENDETLETLTLVFGTGAADDGLRSADSGPRGGIGHS